MSLDIDKANGLKEDPLHTCLRQELTIPKHFHSLVSAGDSLHYIARGDQTLNRGVQTRRWLRAIYIAM